MIGAGVGALGGALTGDYADKKEKRRKMHSYRDSFTGKDNPAPDAGKITLKVIMNIQRKENGLILQKKRESGLPRDMKGIEELKVITRSDPYLRATGRSMKRRRGFLRTSNKTGVYSLRY
ncbi:monoamine oxidase [Candidatus Scalindua japonica]|uniref:Monoamine oxidase n=1 Tax=Candidatus Scalindua japonica TaxID=1284222 RepID=A0A286TYR3_9BACT|nr:hypothetical protein [Candidatus Scalindua japonica]GAX60961.1 monoamine oxidase [Candidatus Scalindua japonica]